MSSFASIRPRAAEWRGWLPPLALALFMFAALLALGGDRVYLYRESGIHNFNTAKTLAIAENLSPEHNFRLAFRVWRDEGGGFRYGLYSPFPIVGYALVKAATLPFGDDLAAKMLAARVLMLLMFCGAAALAFLATSRITGSRWIALAAVLLAFSGLYAVYYADGVFNESVMDAFGAALAFHGMAVFVQEGRFRQLLVKTCAALLLGWHVYALLLPFIALGLGGAAIALARSASESSEKAKAARAAIISLARSRYAALTAVSILLGSTLLALNFANEYTARDGWTLSDLPTFDSLMRRIGQTDDYKIFDDLDWDNFLRRQFYRAGVASTPYAVARAVGRDFPIYEPVDTPPAPAVLGLAATVGALAGLALVRRQRRFLMATMVLFPFCWAIPMRFNTYAWFHTHEAVHYVWLALGLFALALVGARRLLGARLGGALAIAAAAIAAPIFAASVFYAGLIARDANEAALKKAELADFSAIMESARRKSVQVVGNARAWSGDTWYWDYWMNYYLAGSYPRPARNCALAQDADFAVAPYRDDGLDLLTPENRVAFLYAAPPAPELCRAERRRLESSQPAARAVFDVYLQDDAIGSVSYLKAPCEPSDYAAPFFAHVYPANLDSLPEAYRRGEFHPTRTPVKFEDYGVAFDGACLMTLYLPMYPTAAIRTGQAAPDGEAIWDVLITPPPSAAALEYYESAYQARRSSGEPAARAEFDMYLDGDRDTLSYLKEPCGADDARGRFFLSVHPADARDLPEDRRAHGHESLNFDFAPPHGVIFDGKCMATRRLPDYDIERIETGQWIPGGERLWGAEIAVGD